MEIEFSVLSRRLCQQSQSDSSIYKRTDKMTSTIITRSRIKWGRENQNNKFFIKLEGKKNQNTENLKHNI